MLLHTIAPAWGILAVFMSTLWAVHLSTRNAAIVDAGWAAGLPVLAAWYAWRLDGGPRAWLLTLVVAIWGFRLAAYILVTRVIGHQEEGRYVELRSRWKTHLAFKFFVFFQAQALLDVMLSLPFLLAALQGGRPGALAWTALTVWTAASAGEATADAQLSRFKRDPANRGRVCAVGLWRYSRHPNYFFEWMIWISYALYSTTAPWGWAGWLSPAIILFLLFRVTGIPETEAQAVRSRGDAYRRYQETTNVFVPWPPRKRSS